MLFYFQIYMYSYKACCVGKIKIPYLCFYYWNECKRRWYTGASETSIEDKILFPSIALSCLVLSYSALSRIITYPPLLPYLVHTSQAIASPVQSCPAQSCPVQYNSVKSCPILVLNKLVSPTMIIGFIEIFLMLRYWH